jgi:hypothetical protein
VLSEPVELAHLLSPTNDSERLLSRNFLETLIRIDCQGTIRPGLARAWSGDERGRVWTLTLREGTHFPGGPPVEAIHVASLLAQPDGKAAGIDSAAELNHHQVRVYLHEPQETGPRALAEPALAMLDGLASVPGPVRQFDIPARDGRPFIRFEVAQNSDPRDAIDRGVDLAVTRDPAVVEYVTGRPDLLTYALPWSRTYVLLQPSGARTIAGAGVDSLSRSLARDAVRAEARPAEIPFWTDSLALCSAVRPSGTSSSVTSRVAYPRGDEVARGLAERIVAISGDRQLRAAALDDFASALGRAAERAYVVPVPRRTLNPCREALGWPSGASVQPLIDTRATAIIRRGSPQLSVDWDGTVRFDRSATDGDPP